MLNDVDGFILRVAEIGQNHPSLPDLKGIEPFEHYFSGGRMDKQALDKRDGSCTRREILVRFLLLSAVLDQGPDIVGLRQYLVQVLNSLYRREVRILHKPLSFFQELGISVDRILDGHDAVKDVRAKIWADENQSNPNRYRLFMDNASQALGYAIFRWGVPLALPHLLERDALRESPDGKFSPTLLLDYLEGHDSAQKAARFVKSHSRYGLGKAIGNKAAHLFIKWLVTGFSLIRRQDVSWQGLAYEVPYDSNVGRVLWRTGYLLHWADEKAYRRKNVLQPGGGKGGATYLRVTNIRGMASETLLDKQIQKAYQEICIDHLRTHKRPPKKVEIQRIQHAYLLESGGFSAGDFDDGLIYVGTKFCFNHAEPLCEECPLNNVCIGYSNHPQLIENYRT